MTNISAMRALAELNKLAEQRDSSVETQPQERKFNGFSMFGFGFKTQATQTPEDVKPESFDLKS